MLSIRLLKWTYWHFISLTRSSNPFTLRPSPIQFPVVEIPGVLPNDVRRKIQRSTHALDYIEIYKRLALDSDGAAGDKVSVFSPSGLALNGLRRPDRDN